MDTHSRRNSSSIRTHDESCARVRRKRYPLVRALRCLRRPLPTPRHTPGRSTAPLTWWRILNASQVTWPPPHAHAALHSAPFLSPPPSALGMCECLSEIHVLYVRVSEECEPVVTVSRRVSDSGAVTVFVPRCRDRCGGPCGCAHSPWEVGWSRLVYVLFARAPLCVRLYAAGNRTQARCRCASSACCEIALRHRPRQG